MSNEWQRLEPNGRDEDLQDGLKSELADPLWMLARQWQLGEFRGEDAASPVHVRATVSSYPVRTFRNDAKIDASVENFNTLGPLESRVEAESIRNGPAAVSVSAQAGLQFLRRLDAAGLGAARQSLDWQQEFSIDLDQYAIDLSALPEPVAQRIALLARRGIDGRTLYETRSSTLQSLLPSSIQAEVIAVFDDWRNEYLSLFREPDQQSNNNDCWVDERLEYSFSLGASTSDGEVVLSADEYRGGRLDWQDFRVDAQSSHGLEAQQGKATKYNLLPMPVTYRGQPAPRWWEFEDRSVYFGNLAAGPADLARLIVAEFGTVFSDDWFIIPLSVDTGTLNQVEGIRVIDVFGEHHDIASTAVTDYQTTGNDRPWRYFELEGDTSAQAGNSPWLFVPPTLASSLNSQPIEKVTLLRDEVANLAWGIEELIELPTGKSLRRRQQWIAAQDNASSTEAVGEETQAWRYQLQTPVPPWWIPFIPESTGEGSDMRLRRARMQAWQEQDPALVGAKGKLIGIKQALRLFEEEIPSGGIEVTRGWQLARGIDGQVHVWMARHKRPGRGERGSGLEFDVIQRD